MGIEMQRGLTAQGLRQAEVEYYLWAACSYFPFVQIITKLEALLSIALGARQKVCFWICFWELCYVVLFYYIVVQGIKACHKMATHGVACKIQAFSV